MTFWQSFLMQKQHVPWQKCCPGELQNLTVLPLPQIGYSISTALKLRSCRSKIYIFTPLSRKRDESDLAPILANFSSNICTRLFPHAKAYCFWGLQKGESKVEREWRRAVIACKNSSRWAAEQTHLTKKNRSQIVKPFVKQCKNLSAKRKSQLFWLHDESFMRQFRIFLLILGQFFLVSQVIINSCPHACECCQAIPTFASQKHRI